MKNGKRIAAIVGIVLLLAVFALPMLYALTGKEFQMGYFFAALAAAFFVPLVIFIMMEVHRIFVKNEKKDDGSRAIENIIFDVGNVLVLFDWKGLLQSFGFSAEQQKKMEEAMFKSRIWDERDRGLYTEDYYVEQMVALAPEYEADIREYMRRSPETIHQTEYTLTWVKYLKSQGYHLYILSNYSRYMLDANQKEMDFLRYMDGAVFSCDAKELKPEAGIYKKLLNTYHLDPKKSVFIDDRQENLNGAAKLGIQTILFRSFKQAAADLEKKYGVK